MVSLENENELRFSKPLRIRPIAFVVGAHKLWLYGPHYSWSTWIVSRGVYEAKSMHVFEDVGYGIAVNRGGEGGAILHQELSSMNVNYAI